MNDSKTKIDWAQVLHEAITKPGLISSAYFAFHGYSLRNQILALIQCSERGIEPGPMCSFHGWKDHGRHVKKGAKAIELCMPLQRKIQKEDANGETVDGVATFYAFRKNWFVLAQTEGDAFKPSGLVPGWDKARALQALDITEQAFENLNGNVQGYAKQRSISISPIAAMPHKTTFHELAHVVLGHTAEQDFSDSEHTPRSLRECEAEAVALICCEHRRHERESLARDDQSRRRRSP